MVRIAHCELGKQVDVEIKAQVRWLCALEQGMRAQIQARTRACAQTPQAKQQAILDDQRHGQHQAQRQADTQAARDGRAIGM